MMITSLIFLLLAGFAAETTQQQTSLKVRPTPQTDYVLGPGDQIAIRAANLEEISDKPITIDTGGYIRLPLAGPNPRRRNDGSATRDRNYSAAQNLRAAPGRVGSGVRVS